MMREEYLAQLEALLTGRVPADELGRMLDYYRSYFDEAGPQGEARVMDELGSPAELAARIMEARRGQNARETAQPPAQRSRSGFGALWKVLLAICAAPIAIPLILLAAALALLILLMAVGVVLGFVIGGVACVAAGAAAAWSGVAVIFTAGMATTMLRCGAGMLCGGLGLLLIAGGFALGSLLCGALAGALSRWLLRREGAV